ncbi:ferroxidase fet3 [Phytophthora pseudosyringae]|uniref:Ferroxidase fet3 n=1 Tax=Phytophthora pseudosyringae TaxID=221518 RepID=A0A8T1V4I6_9STRA|nr:ferroxidase fet3 [Phytophthora pseudosyringae]
MPVNITTSSCRPRLAARAETAKEGFNDEALAIVHYTDEGGAEPTTDVCQGKTTMNEFNYVPLIPAVLPAKAADRATLELDMRRSGPNMATSPVMVAITPSSRSRRGLLSSELLEVRPYGKHVVVTMNDMNEQHPFHMHMLTSWIVGSGAASIEDVRRSNLPPLKLQGAMMRGDSIVPPCTTSTSATSSTASRPTTQVSGPCIGTSTDGLAV